MPLNPAAAPMAPVATRVDHNVEATGGIRNDPYFWMRDDERKDPRMLAHLAAENAYTDAVLAPLAPLKAELYEEIVARIKQDDASVPYRDRGYWYFSRFSMGAEYPVHLRRADRADAAEEVLIDGPARAAGHDYYSLGDLGVSYDDKLLGFTEDTVGRRQYTLRVLDLASGRLLDDAVEGISPGFEWSRDSRAIYYVENDPETLLTRRVKRHVLGTDPATDVVLYEEPDDSFYIEIYRSRSERFICIAIEATVSSEVRCADDSAGEPMDFRVLAARQQDFEYSADHLGESWVIRTNWNAPDFKLMTVPTADIGDRNRWRDLVPAATDVYLEGFELFDSFIAIEERSNALRRLRILPTSGEPSFIASDEPAYTMALGENAEASARTLRYNYASLTTPTTTYDINLDTGERTLLKRDPVLGDFDPTHYATQRLWAPARDGEKIPVSIVYRRDVPLDGTAPLLQYGYGAYGISIDPSFRATRLSLLDRGVVIALAHIRGGQELGRRWYEGGRLGNKVNTFTDFIDVTDFLVAEKTADPGRIAIQGGSAGGLLVGAVINMAPEKYVAVLASVPFVDVVTTMLDETIPLTTNEFDEWGNPAEPAAYATLLAYSPYDNVRTVDYPAIYVDTGLWDSQVQYFEPAKWVARLREATTGDAPILFRINMDAGHGGKSGRFAQYLEVAEEYAFLLDRFGLAHLISEKP